ncbi:MAG: hypothetical protein C0524_13755 [Rhodobacter sp.]|nr:hypothetical protein [Rhodobacter sp.]
MQQIGLTTSADGGMTKAVGMQDASFALGEQFCLARTFAMAKGNELMAQIASFTRPDRRPMGASARSGKTMSPRCRWNLWPRFWQGSKASSCPLA